MTATDEQVRIMMSERNKGRTQSQAAAKANVKSRQTVAKYEQLGVYPSERPQERQYRTREDPFAALPIGQRIDERTCRTRHLVCAGCV